MGTSPKNGKPAHSVGQRGLDQPAEHAGFTFLQANVVFNFSLAESRFAHSPNCDVRAHRRNLDRGVDRHLAIREQMRREFQDHAHVLELKLRAGQQSNS